VDAHGWNIDLGGRSSGSELVPPLGEWKIHRPHAATMHTVGVLRDRGRGKPRIWARRTDADAEHMRAIRSVPPVG
jgi:hypothetical protein